MNRRSSGRRIVLGPWPKLLRALPLAAALPVAHVHAQVAQPISPYTPPAPVNLDPGASPATTAPVAEPPRSPSVVIMNSDGSIREPGQGSAAAPTGTYISPDQVGVIDEPDVVRNGATPELHVVRKGDTLWDICSLYFNDPWQWPKIWSYNPQVTNPHWIYPGDLIRLLPRGMFSQAPTPTPSSSSPSQPAVDHLPAPLRSFQVGIKQTAFVEKSDLDRSITLVGAEDEKVLLGKDDDVYLEYPQGKPPKVGDRYSIYIPGNLIKSNGTDVGAYVQVIGSVVIKSVSQDKRARGIITESNREIERGAKVGPLLKEFHPVPPVADKVDAQGNVVAMLTYDQLIGQGEVLFIDLGK